MFLKDYFVISNTNIYTDENDTLSLLNSFMKSFRQNCLSTRKWYFVILGRVIALLEEEFMCYILDV